MDTQFAGKSLLYCAVLAFGPCIPIMAQERDIAPPPPGVAAEVDGCCTARKCSCMKSSHSRSGARWGRR